MLPAKIRTVGKLKTKYSELFINMTTLIGRQTTLAIRDGIYFLI